VVTVSPIAPPPSTIRVKLISWAEHYISVTVSRNSLTVNFGKGGDVLRLRRKRCIAGSVVTTANELPFYTVM